MKRPYSLYYLLRSGVLLLSGCERRVKAKEGGDDEIIYPFFGVSFGELIGSALAKQLRTQRVEAKGEGREYRKGRRTRERIITSPRSPSIKFSLFVSYRFEALKA